jgi:hypothetical protein
LGGLAFKGDDVLVMKLEAQIEANVAENDEATNLSSEV